MKKGYWFVAYRSVSDAEAVAAYGAMVLDAVASFEPRPIVRGMPAEVQGVGQVARTVVIEFPSLKHAIDAYHSEGYRKALTIFNDGAERDFRIIEGV